MIPRWNDWLIQKRSADSLSAFGRNFDFEKFLVRFTQIYSDLLRFTQIYSDLLRFAQICSDYVSISWKTASP